MENKQTNSVHHCHELICHIFYGDYFLTYFIEAQIIIIFSHDIIHMVLINAYQQHRAKNQTKKNVFLSWSP